MPTLDQLNDFTPEELKGSASPALRAALERHRKRNVAASFGSFIDPVR